ncbi:MAG: 3-oxoacyl-[acyl-carrier-protein] reductase [Lentisphaeria bacterium]|nr:3-oxoacyl-[acyl-carrier-protein] reductase [Lentisphaeria bacterium]
MKLENKIAIVTGGARGIGKAISMSLANEGATIAIVDINEEAAQETADEMNKAGFTAKGYKANVASPEDVNAMVKAVIADFGQVDILVNNAGITRDNLIMRMSENEWDLVIDINLKGTFNCIKAVTRPMMKARSGKIVNIASIVGVMGNAGQANYCASKGGVIGLTKSAARELAARNINVNGVAPGYIQTEMTEVLSDEAKEWFMNNIPLKRAGSPDSVASVVTFLAGPDSEYITGQTINLDGGMVMQ